MYTAYIIVSILFFPPIHLSLEGLEQLDHLDVGVQEAVETVAYTLLFTSGECTRGDVGGDAFLETHVGELSNGRLNLRLGRLLLDERKNLLAGALVEVLQQCGIDVLAHGVVCYGILAVLNY